MSFSFAGSGRGQGDRSGRRQRGGEILRRDEAPAPGGGAARGARAQRSQARRAYGERTSFTYSVFRLRLPHYPDYSYVYVQQHRLKQIMCISVCVS